MLSGLLGIIDELLSSCGDERIIVLTTDNNHGDRVDAALICRFGKDIYIDTSSPQPIDLPDGGEIVQLDSSEQKTLVDFDATNNGEYQSGVLVSTLEKENTREASKRRCMTKSALSLVDSTTRISSTDFDAPDNKAYLVRAFQSGPNTFKSEKKNTSGGSKVECLSMSLLSLDDLTKRISFPDFDATRNKAHLVGAYQSGPIVSLSGNKNMGEALKIECLTKSILGLEDLQQPCGVRHDDAAMSFGGNLQLLSRI